MPFRQFHDDLALAPRQIGQDVVADLRGRHSCMVEYAYAELLSIYLEKWPDLGRDTYGFLFRIVQFLRNCP
jgi:hypothetical protein